MKQPGSAADPLWYKDAILYELHVRSFYDSNGDGVGDFPGVIDKLDYLQDLGVTCVWLLPFYPSPLRDDGYDIARYEGVHPSYGTLRDCRRFIREAHARGLQVVTELVINHTSSDHPWFQAARMAPPGSPRRNFYVWSDSKTRYEGVRIIFSDTERSNWTWDAEAGAYYWHRFFHHQPDLNFDNPAVRRRVLRTMRFWLNMGIDGLRLDAVPYLVEREGTTCENLPETHEVLREIRRAVDEGYESRMLLAEANLWPDDMRAYFGGGDECHMAFNFPLMPRLYMALMREDRHPITEIFRHTPDIPESCQWALFLRNHDELTLESVSAEERDYMYLAYAADPQMRLNAGIRRRLAPLLENSRPRIELLNSFLFSLPGTPVIYYGDEIGMGDNIYLGDRNGVRTPMQWTSERNAGFSRADPQRLFAPPIMDPVYGYQSVNVEAQQRSPFSLLNWMKRLITIRKQHATLSRGSVEFLAPRNRRVLAYVRRHGDNTVLVVANLSRSVQTAELNLGPFEGLTPIEMFDGAEFPRIAEHPYFVTLGPYGFYWFTLERTPSVVTRRQPPLVVEAEAEPLPLLAGSMWETLLEGHLRTLIERERLLWFLDRQPWFSRTARPLRASIVDWSVVRSGREPTFLVIANIDREGGQADQWCLPLAMLEDPAGRAIADRYPSSVVSRISGARSGFLVDAMADRSTIDTLLPLFSEASAPQFRSGRPLHMSAVVPRATGPQPAHDLLRRTIDEGSEIVSLGDLWLLKLNRRIVASTDIEVEVSRHVHERMGLPRVPRIASSMSCEIDNEPGPLGHLMTIPLSQATAWDHVVNEVGRYYDRAQGYASEPPRVEPRLAMSGTAPSLPSDIAYTLGGFPQTASLLGRRLGELHVALASAGGDPAFSIEPLSRAEVASLVEIMKTEARMALDDLERHEERLIPIARTEARAALDRRDAVLGIFNAMDAAGSWGARTRVHGQCHLEHVMWAEDDFVFFNFGGAAMPSTNGHRTKQSPLCDVGEIIASLGYAAAAGRLAKTGGNIERDAQLRPWARLWAIWNAGALLRAYLQAVGSLPAIPDRAEFERMLRAFILRSSLRALRLELERRPEWVAVTLSLVNVLVGEVTDSSA